MIYIREIKQLLRKFWYSDKNKTIGQKWKQSIFAVICALLFTSVLIIIKGENPLIIFRDIVRGSFKTSEAISQTILYFSMFVLAGMSIIIGFKSGLFNIGIGGQMLISGTAVMIIAIKTNLAWPILLLMAMLIAAASASISGVLKALFNIHEVVSTILINWIFFWISQYLLGNDKSWMNGYGSTKPLVESSRMMIGSSLALPALLTTGILLVLAILFFRFTKWGFALKEVGENPNAAKYSGIKITVQLALGMALSGLAAGALASVNYLGKYGSMSYSIGQSLPSIGFQGISVALISFNSLYGLIPAAIFWSVITSGTDYSSIIHPDIPKEILSLMNGFIIYAISISIIFIRFRPISFCAQLWARLKSKEIKVEIQKYKRAKNAEKTLFYGSAKTSENNDLKINKILNAKKSELRKINGEICLKTRKFNLKNKIYLTLSKKIRTMKTEELFQQLEPLNKTKDHLILEIRKINQNKSKIKNKINKKQLKVGIEILKNEHTNRLNNLNRKFQDKRFFGRLFIKYKTGREKNNNFESLVVLQKIYLKDKIVALKVSEKNIKKRKIKKKKLIDVYNKSIKKMEIDILKKKVGK